MTGTTDDGGVATPLHIGIVVLTHRVTLCQDTQEQRVGLGERRGYNILCAQGVP
jgi:hypothetical protein